MLKLFYSSWPLQIFMTTKRNMDLYDPNAPKPFIISVSSRALFDLEESHRHFEEFGEKAFIEYQLAHEDVPLKPGSAMGLVKKILAANENLPEGARPFEVILLSRNSPETGLRVFNTVEQMGLNIYRAVFTSGTAPSKYLKAIGADLMLSSNPVEVKKALDMGVAAATLMPHPYDDREHDDGKIRIAFDGDAVLFSDEAERIHAQGGLELFREHEIKNAKTPLGAGPFRGFLEVIHELQQAFPDQASCPIRTALVTARGMPTHKRAILTLRSWGVRIDEGIFLAGKDKGPLLEAFGADLFLDDSQRNIDNAISSRIPSGHVPHGIRNSENADESQFTGGQGPIIVPPKSKQKMG